MSDNFQKSAKLAIDNKDLQESLQRLNSHFILARSKAMSKFGHYDNARAVGLRDKNRTLNNWRKNILLFEKQLQNQGGNLHFTSTTDSANSVIWNLLKKYDANKLIKSKSMVSEEVGVNQFLSDKIPVIETDLGEYIIQLRNEKPSHIIAPAFHLSKKHIIQAFIDEHKDFDPKRNINSAANILKEVRGVLRSEFVTADAGLTGANMLIAETGSIVLVTNEGNADLLHSNVKHLIVLASLDKIIDKVASATNILRLLARSATGQDISVYTSFITGVRGKSDSEGPETIDVIVIDNKRSSWLGSPAQDLLRCIHCGACMNHCPVYSKIGGHAYGTVYPGPIGAAISPKITSIKQTTPLPFASSFCSRCEEVCPMSIPLVSVLRENRNLAFSQKTISKTSYLYLKFYGFIVTRPRLYRFSISTSLKILHYISLFSKSNYLPKMPFISNWQRYRKIVKLGKSTFIAKYVKLSHDKK